MGETKDPVVFLLGDTGVEASNDPRWYEKKQREEVEAQVREKYLEEQENRGTATVSDWEAHEQLGTGAPRGMMDGLQVQPPATPVRIVGDDTKQQSTPSDELDKPLEEMTGDELKAEVKRLKDEEGIEVDTKGVSKKSELVERIKAAKEEA